MKAMPGLLKFAQIDSPSNLMSEPVRSTLYNPHLSPVSFGLTGAGIGALGGMGLAGLTELKRRWKGEASIGAGGLLKHMLIGTLGGAGIGAAGAAAANANNGRAYPTWGDSAWEQDMLQRANNASMPGTAPAEKPASAMPSLLKLSQAELWPQATMPGSNAYANTQLYGDFGNPARNLPALSPEEAKRQLTGLGLVASFTPAAPYVFAAQAPSMARDLGKYLGARSGQTGSPSLHNSHTRNTLGAEGTAAMMLPMAEALPSVAAAAPGWIRGPLTGAAYAFGMGARGVAGSPDEPIKNTAAIDEFDASTRQLKDNLAKRRIAEAETAKALSQPSDKAPTPTGKAPPVAKEPSGMSNTAKGLLAAGGVAAGGLGLYALIRHLRNRKQQKTAQSVFEQAPGMPTLNDLMGAIANDPELDPMRRNMLMNQVSSAAGNTSGSTPLRSLMNQGMGGIIGWLMSKYFGAGPVGQVFGALAGMGVGNLYNPPAGQHKGYMNLWEAG